MGDLGRVGGMAVFGGASDSLVYQRKRVCIKSLASCLISIVFYDGISRFTHLNTCLYRKCSLQATCVLCFSKSWAKNIIGKTKTFSSLMLIYIISKRIKMILYII